MAEVRPAVDHRRPDVEGVLVRLPALRKREAGPVIEPTPPPTRDVRAEHLAMFAMSPAAWDRQHRHKPVRKIRRSRKWWDDASRRDLLHRQF